ncbi:hypothetical protein JTB14_027385 [Gonioctena quinquepunctata]|nr:hypothetical protein JTB14_027385 [Gonioctena quinquepunctata]
MLEHTDKSTYLGVTLGSSSTRRTSHEFPDRLRQIIDDRQPLFGIECGPVRLESREISAKDLQPTIHQECCLMAPQLTGKWEHATALEQK